MNICSGKARLDKCVSVHRLFIHVHKKFADEHICFGV